MRFITARVAYISGLKTLSFTLTGYLYNIDRLHITFLLICQEKILAIAQIRSFLSKFMAKIVEGIVINFVKFCISLGN